MATRKITFIVILLLLLMLGFASFYTVPENSRAIVLRLGQIQAFSDGQPKVKQPGLHFKIPFIDQVKWFDMRTQTLDIEHSSIVTQQKKDVIVDYYIKWRIRDIPLFFTRTSGSAQRAGELLKQQLNDSLRAEFGRRSIREVVVDERSQIMDRLLTQANEDASQLGIDVIDVRIKGIELPPQVSKTIFERMRSERERIATQYRAEGRSEANAIRANADAQTTIIIAQANAKAAQIRAEGEGQAAKIYADAFNRDPQFYSFYRSLLAYQNTFANKRDILLLSPNTEFFKYFSDFTHHALSNKNNKK